MFDLFLKLYNGTYNSFLDTMKNNLKVENKMFIVPLNSEIFMLSETHEDFYSILYEDKTTLVPEGMNVVKSARKLGLIMRDNFSRIDLSADLLTIANENHYKLALLGSTEEVLQLLIHRINRDYPNIDLVLVQNGYIEDKDIFFKKAIDLEPDITLVALGTPIQEEMIYKYIKKFKKGIFMGVGSTFDVLSGYKKRTPKIFIKTNTEWLYRLVKEPKRLKSLYQNNIKFIYKVKKLKNSM